MKKVRNKPEIPRAISGGLLASQSATIYDKLSSNIINPGLNTQPSKASSQGRVTFEFQYDDRVDTPDVTRLKEISISASDNNVS